MTKAGVKWGLWVVFKELAPSKPWATALGPAYAMKA